MPEWIQASTLRKKLDKEVFAAVMELDAQGWKITKQGHAYRSYCPCDGRAAGGRGFHVPGTAPNPGNVARRLLRNAERCPDNHDLMR